MSSLPKAIQPIYNSRIPLACAMIALVGMILRFLRLNERNLWNDEHYQIGMCVGPLKRFWLHNYYGDFSCFPGEYLITYPFLKWFGEDKWGIMIPHILLTLVGFYLLYFVCQRYFKTIWGFVITFALVAFNENLIFHNFELRPYSVLPTLAIGGLLFSRVLFSEFSRLTKGHKIWIAVFYIFMTIYHVYGLICASFIFLFEFLSRYKDSAAAAEMKKMAFRKYFFSLYVVLAAIWIWYAAPNLGLVEAEITRYETRRPTFEFIPNPIINLVGFLKGIFGNLLNTKWLKWTVLGMVCVFFPGNPQRYNQLGFFFLCIIWGVMLVFLFSLFKEYWFIQRQFIWVMPLFAFFIGWCWDSLALIIQSRKRTWIKPT